VKGRGRQLDREIAAALAKPRSLRHHATVKDLWDVVMDAFMIGDVDRAATITREIVAESQAQKPTKAFEKVLCDAASAVRERYFDLAGVRYPCKSWQGTIYNERLINSVRNGLVAIYLDGVEGVSPDRGGWAMISASEADRILAKARRAYVDLADQKPMRSVKSWRDRHVKELKDLLDKAVAVREGRAEQKMTAEDYAARRRR
jgi:hypothetical protein